MITTEYICYIHITKLGPMTLCVEAKCHGM